MIADNDDLGLSLSLSCSKTTTSNHNNSSMNQNNNHSPLQFNLLPSMLSSLCSTDLAAEDPCKPVGGAEEGGGGVSSVNSTVTCLSGKRSEREVVSEEDEDGEGVRKKLRLTKEQSAVLEDSFKENHTLNPKQKVGLAKRLGLRPRQVEVWFQNRRARTKLKQTEMDYELMKKWCEQLTEENRRLQKEVHELRALKVSPQFYMTPATTLTMCTECQQRRSPWLTRVEPVRP